MTLILTGAEIAGAAALHEVIDVVEYAHAELHRGAAVQPDRSSVLIPGGDVLMVPMVAAISALNAAGVKVLMDGSGAPVDGRPTQQSAIVLMNATTGSCEAFLDGAAVTLLRTAAASAVATRHLAGPAGGTLGILGAGRQAGVHLAAMRAVRPVHRVAIWNRTRARAEQFAEVYREDDLPIDVLDSCEDVVRAADILCTLTPSRRPVVRGEWLAEGMHVNAVGAPPRLDHREIDTAGIVRSRVVVDSYQTVVAESGDVMIPVAEGAIDYDHFRTELGAVITGDAVGRRNPSDITLYNSVGVGIQDIATARLVVDRARTLGIGTELSLDGYSGIAPLTGRITAPGVDRGHS